MADREITASHTKHADVLERIVLQMTSSLDLQSDDNWPRLID